MTKVKIKIVFVLLFLLQLTLLAYNATNFSSEQLFENYFMQSDENKSVLDTIPSDGDPEETGQFNVKDVSGMFNERGFYKSNSSSYDESEIINNYNGNLQYSIPMFNFEGIGDISCNLSLNYNGSVSNNIIAGGHPTLISEASYRIFNMNTPEWIFSLNGFAVQLLNYPTRYVSYDVSYNQNDSIPSKRIDYLTNGYHITQKLGRAENSDKDYIMFLRGDGSTLKLEKTGSCESEADCYIGEYYSDNRGEYVRASVTYNPNDNYTDPVYRDRIAKVYFGDGLEYTFYEEKTEYDLNIVPENMLAYIRPQTFMLKKIQDRFGRFIELEYTRNVVVQLDTTITYGRRLLESISVQGGITINFTYVQSNNSATQGIIYVSSPQEKFRLNTSSISFTDEYEPKKPTLEEIINNVKDTISIQNEVYWRYGTNIKQTWDLNAPRAIMRMKLSRMKKLSNYFDGTREYAYYPNDSTISCDFEPYPEQYKILSWPSLYKGYGRDPFFNNMVEQKKSYYTTNVNSKYQEVDYTYEYIPGPGRENENIWRTDIVSDLDSNYTTKNISDVVIPSIEGTPSSISSKYYFQNFKLYTIVSNPENVDWPGYTKLVWEKSYTNNQFQPHYSITREFIKVPYAGIFLGSFMDTLTIENIKGVERITKNRYWHAQNFPKSDSTFNPIVRTLTTDPLGQITNTYFKIFHQNSIHYLEGNYNPYPPPNNDQFYDTTLFYKINNDTLTEVYSNKLSLIAKSRKVYFNETNSLGYLGQVHKIIDFNKSNFSNYLQSEFEYYRNDTTGLSLYPTYRSKPSIEGNLKLAKDPKANTTTYFYHPVQELNPTQDTSLTEQNIIPIIWYRLFTSGNEIKNDKSYFQNLRFPIATKTSANNVNLYNFFEYDYNGNITKFLNHDKILTSVSYDFLYRLTKVILPYDFDATGDSIYLQIDTSMYSFRNLYTDPQNMVTSYKTIWNSGIYKKSEVIFNGFYQPIQTRLYTGASTFDSTAISYNHFDLPFIQKDGRNNATNFYYDDLLNLRETKNPDNSVKLINNTYQNSLSTHFGSISGMINLQEFVDETGKTFLKYFDAVGNLRREVKYTEYSENDPDSENPLENLIPMYTDYDYDDLYRLIGVRTPNGKNISYSYDGYGRVSQRVTPDAGTTKYKFDYNGNLTYSQDQNQANTGANYYTFRYYDGLNRLTGVGTNEGGIDPVWNDVNGEDPYEVDNPLNPYGSFLLYNVYDTTANAPSEIFSAPSNYGSNNMTKGNLVATAYKTSKLDPWNLKYYRYDARGRIIKMWHKINGLPDWKEVYYTFNSADIPVYLNYQPTKYDSKLYQYLYDNAARLNDVKIYTGGIAPENPNIENPWLYESFVSYGYNQNSQINSQQFSTITSSEFAYNNRNWLTNYDNDIDLFDFNLTYFANGNIETQELTGDYTNWLNDKTQLVYEYKYDKSNRLLRADQLNSSGYSIWNSYDKDGNILTLKRHDVGGSPEDNFSYLYITNTNKLKRVSGSVDQFFYDGNGNMIADSLNGTYHISYDYRNLIVQLYYTKYVDEDSRAVLRTFSEFYKYDDAGNRIKKVIRKYVGTDPEPEITSDEEESIYWTYELIQHYVRDVTGNELAIYNDTTVTFWNVYGLDNAGKINYSDNSWNYYLKDHLGTPRVVLDQSGDIISAEDLDMWGYRMADRSFQSDTAFYKYTGKERDITTGYDYFGARYYVGKIGRWMAVDTLFETHFDFSPYAYSIDNSLNFFDPDGRDPRDKNYKGGGGGGIFRFKISKPSFSPAQRTTTDKVAPKSIPRTRSDAKDKVKITKKISNKMESRDWTEKSIQNTVENSYTTRKATNKATGGDATAYYNKDGSYVVVDNTTKQVIQISNRTSPKTWIPDNSIVNPYHPD